MQVVTLGPVSTVPLGQLIGTTLPTRAGIGELFIEGHVTACIKLTVVRVFESAQSTCIWLTVMNYEVISCNYFTE